MVARNGDETKTMMLGLGLLDVWHDPLLMNCLLLATWWLLFSFTKNYIIIIICNTFCFSNEISIERISRKGDVLSMESIIASS